MKRMIPFLMLSCFLLVLGCENKQQSVVHTTLTKNLPPITRRNMQGFELSVGSGEPHKLRTLYKGAPEPSGSFWSLAYFLVMTDQHIVDEQSPTRSSFFDTITVLDGLFEAAYRPQEDLASQILNATVLTANRLNCTYGRDLDMVLSLGDSADNGELAEFSWAFDIMSGNSAGQIAPWTGSEVRDFGPQQPYNPYLRPAWPDSNASFPVVGLRTCDQRPMPWYSVVGNHDVLNIGNFPVDMPEWPLNNFFFTGDMYTGGLSAFGYIEGLPKLVIETINGRNMPAPAFYERLTFYNEPLLAAAMGRLMSDPKTMEFLVEHASLGPDLIRSAIDTNLKYSQLNADDPSVTKDQIGVHVLPDEFRQFLGPKGLFEMTRETGHGCWANQDSCNSVFRRGQDPDEGYYTLDNYTTGSGLQVPIRLIFLNTDEKPLSAVGGMSKTQWKWFECQLDRAWQDRKLVIILSHIPWSGIFDIPGVCLSSGCLKKFTKLLQSYPNVITHLAGHTHTNTITPFPDNTNPKNGFWEVVTCSTQVWPQQTRIIEVVVYENGVAEIWSTMLDHTDHLSESEPLNQLSSLARYVGLNDPQMEISMNDEGLPKYAGRIEDRNVILRFDVPAEIVSFLQANIAPSSQIQSRDVFAEAADWGW